MNFDSFQDTIKALNGIKIESEGVEYSILFPFIKKNRKIGLVVETEEIVFENTSLEFETRRLTTLDVTSASLIDASKASFFSTIMNGDTILFNKVGCQEIEATEESIRNLYTITEVNRAKSGDSLEQMIVATSAYLNLSKQHTMIYLRDDVCYFGKIDGVRKVVMKRAINYKDIQNHMCDKTKMNDYFINYMNSLEDFYCSLSALNQSKNGRNQKK